MPTATLTDVLVKDLTKDAITRLDSLIKAVAVIQSRSDRDEIPDGLAHLRAARTELLCSTIEVES